MNMTINKKLIQELLNDDETRGAIAAPFGLGDGPMRAALKTLINEPAKGEVITIEVSDHMWVRGEYVRTATNGEVVVEVPANRSEIVGASAKYHRGKRVDLVINGGDDGSDV